MTPTFEHNCHGCKTVQYFSNLWAKELPDPSFDAIIADPDHNYTHTGASVGPDGKERHHYHCECGSKLDTK